MNLPRASVPVESLLHRVERPARYLGQELNSVHKDPAGKLRFALSFPDTYEVGMSHLGLRILYHALNEQEGIVCERVFSPWLDMEALLRSEHLPLFTLESGAPVRSFDVLGISLPYEMLYSNVLNLLELAGIPLANDDRDDGDPIVIAGGPACFNPEPIAGFVDVFVLGEAEEAVLEICQVVGDRSSSRRDRIARIGRIPGCYLPSEVQVGTTAAGAVAHLRDGAGAAWTPVLKRVVADLDRAPFPTRQIVPSIPIVHDRAQLETHRGCMWGCRFCQAGMLYRAQRERSLSTLLAQAQEVIRHTGYEELGLASLDSVDYSRIQELVDGLNLRFAGKHVAIGLPSLRMDSFSIDLANALQRVKKTQLTLAPEAGSQRLRDVINKNLTAQQCLDTVKAALDAGWRDLKLYFMIGLPTETDADLVEMGQLIREMKRLAKGCSGRPLSLTCAVSPFVAKPHTPFQWARQCTVEELCHKIDVLKTAVPRHAATLKWRQFELAQLEGVFSRGDRRLGRVLRTAHRMGCKFEGWTECFDHGLWMKAFEAEGIDPATFVHRERDEHEAFPWEVVSTGVSRSFLWADYVRSLAGETVPGCGAGKTCAACGLKGRGMGC
ncbi:MAG: TIGR03960 family B12-binding radical SAM protein [Candidatus Riflebacteria bacterium]|nr:TIGR03960 family B12-binding radical SAM protein [Candidatus Riflebacteria bacterium]